MSLRSKRLEKRLDPLAAALLDSTREDARILGDDVLGSLAHVGVLETAQLLKPDEAQQLRRALAALHDEAESGALVLDPELEDVHMNVESRLTQALGDLGKKLHTARSRNDQVALDLRLFARRHVFETAGALEELIRSLLDLGEKHGDAILPGYTHLQVAQPVLLRFQLQAHAERFLRDMARLKDAYARLNVSPLGAGALAGTRHTTDPTIAAAALGFATTFRNAMDAVSDRDFVAELLFANALTLTHASGLAEEFILFTSQEFGFATIADQYATGSSLMPQKKNPDVLEVTRGRSATALGALTASLAALKSLPSAYNRDLQEQKRLFLDEFPRLAPHLRVLAGLVATTTFHPERMLAAAERGHGDATDLADYLVTSGVPFRDAHEQAATLVRRAIELNVSLSKLSLEELHRVNPKIKADVSAWLGPKASVHGKASAGSTGPKAVDAAARGLRDELEALHDHFEARIDAVRSATQRLLQVPREVRSA